MRTSKLVDEIIVADSIYFYKQKFISAQQCNAVKCWIEGVDDEPTQFMAASWLNEDAYYFEQLSKFLCRYHWFMWPIMWLFLKIVPGRLRGYARKLRGGR